MGYDSLVIANSFELLNGRVPSSNPLCPGAIFSLQPGADPGAPQPTSSVVASLLLDGEIISGRRSSNRLIKLPVWILAPGYPLVPADRRVMAAAREALAQAINQDFFTITWTRDPTSGNPGGVALPMVLDCFRAGPTAPTFNILQERQGAMQVLLTLPALPYGRSDVQDQVPFLAPVPTSPPIAPPPTPVLLDDYSTISTVRVLQSPRCVVGPNTACWDPDRFGDPGGQLNKFDYSNTFAAPLNLQNMTALQFWFGLGSRYYANLEFHGKTHGTSFNFTLTDTSGNTLAFSRNNVFLAVSQTATDPVFARITVPIPQNSSTFNYGSVASYTLEVVNRVDRVRRLSWVTAYLDNLMALPGSQSVSPVVRGTVYTLTPKGTARAPATMSFQQPATPGTVTTITTVGPGSYTVPALTAYGKVQNTGGAAPGGV